MIRYLLILQILITCNLPAFAQAPVKLDTVTLQLKWKHQFQFAGYYAALEKGYYREAGLDVRLIEGGPGREAVPAVVADQADFGISNSELLLHRKRGAPVVALAAIIQHSPLALMVRRDSGIRTVRDLAGRRLMIGGDAAELFAYFRRAGLDPKNVQEIRHSQDVKDLIEKRVDGFSSYITDQAFLLRQAGVGTIEFRGVYAGIDFYGDTLFTTERQVHDHPERVRAFRAASLKGWLYALRQIEEIAELIRVKYASDRTLEHLRWEAEGYRNLIVPDLVDIGHMSESRWRHIAETYAELGMLPQGFDFTGMLYDPNPRDLRWLYPWLIGGAAALLVMMGFTVYVVRSRAMLRGSEERVRAIIDTEPECVKVVAPDGKLVEMNMAGLKMLEADSLAAITDKSLLDFVLPDYREAFGRLHRRVIGGDSGMLEFEIAGLKGRRRWLETHAAPLRDSAGRVTALLGVTRDITERKQAEGALRSAHDELEQRVLERTAELNQSNALLQQKEEQLMLAQRAGHIGLWNRDLTTGADQISAEWRDLMGFPLNQPRVGYAEFLARIHPDDRARMQSRTSTLPDGDFEAEFRIEHPEKGERWILSRGRRGISPEDGHLHMMGALIDVTARKRTEEKLTATKNLLQKVMDSSPDWIFAKDLNHRFLFVNRAFAEAQSLAPDDMIGRFDTEFWSEELCEGNPGKGIRGFHEDDRAAFRGEAVHNPADPATFSDRSLHIFDTFKSPMRDEAGRIFGVLCYCRDTTERKQAEEALRDSEARLRAILDHNPAPVFIKDTAGRYVHVNKRFEELFGLQGTHSEGKTDAELFASEQAKAFQRNDRKVLDLGQAIQFEEVAQYYDGEHTSIVNKFPLRDGQGKVYALCGIATDITERKRAEEALRKLTDDLDRRVVERTRELAESQARLRALVAELSRAEERERRRLAVELHDYLAQMLTISRLNIGRADKLAADDALKKRLVEALESVDDSIAYTRSLMAQLSPRMLYDLGLPAALAWLGAQQKERHGLDVELSGEAEELALDEERSVLAYQCVRELLWNVVKHAETNQAIISYGLEHGELIVEVADDGRGFDPDRLHGNGNGLEKLGLFSIRERLELFGGKLEVTSQPGQGTRARFTLPAPQTEMAPVVTQDAKPASAAKAAGKRLRVALVDDHEVVRRGLRQLLEEFADLTVVGEANDGLEGIELARQFSPDVVVMDINMPRMNGIEATKLIIQEMPSTIVVGLSFDSGTQVAQAMKAAGAVTCVTKERAVEDIHQVIMDAVEERRTLRMDNGKLIIDNG